MAGRPRKDNINTQQLIINLAKSGMSNVAIAEATGLGRDTIQRWLAHTELGDTVKTVREVSAMLETKQKHALNKSAILAAKKLLKKRKIEETEERYDAKGKLLYTKKRVKETEPNASIIQFVLKNTDPANWGDNIQNTAQEEQDTDITINIVGGE